LKSYLYHSRPG